MALVQDIARFTFGELGLHKIEPVTASEKELVYGWILEGSGNSPWKE